MIKSYKEMSTLYLKQNKKRTILTLIGIILSISLISTVLLFMKGTTAASIENSKKISGSSYHIGYRTYDNDILTKVKNNPNVKSYGLFSSERIEYNNIFMEKINLDKGASEFLNYSLKEGRMPKNKDEICIEDWAKGSIDEEIDIGKDITIEGEKYTIVGILRNEGDSQKENSIRCYFLSEDIKDGQLLVELNTNGQFNETIKTLSSLTDTDNLIRNNDLIRIIKMGSNKSFIVITFIVIAIVVCATIIVIYNSFQINVSERMKQFGLLKSIGATKKQIRSIVFREATTLLMIAIPIGLLLSIGVIYIIDMIFKLLLKGGASISMVTIDIKMLGISTLITIVAVYISSLLPANYVGKISPLIAINSNAVIKKEKIKRRKNTLAKKVLNYKAVMAIKNVKRNPRRFRVMILSIIVSSVLFITFTSLMNFAFDFQYAYLKNSYIDLEISGKNESFEINEANSKEDEKMQYQLMNKISNIDNVNKIYSKYTRVTGFAEIPEDKRVKDAGDIYDKLEKEKKKKGLNANIKAYDKVAFEDLEKRLINGSINIDKISSENGVILVSDGIARDIINRKLYLGKLTNYKVGDEITIHKDGKEYKVKVMAIVDREILDIEQQKNTITLITTDNVLEGFANTDISIEGFGITLKDKGDHLKTDDEIRNLLEKYPNYNLTNFVDINKESRNIIIMMQVLAYGFIFIITLISSINIINTISMNITVRRKEIAMLKSIGMSQKDIKKMIVYEGLFYGLFGGITGAAIGAVLTFMIFKILLGVVTIQWKSPLILSIITILVTILISYVSALIPMKKIQKNNIIEVIREE